MDILQDARKVAAALYRSFPYGDPSDHLEPFELPDHAPSHGSLDNQGEVRFFDHVWVVRERLPHDYPVFREDACDPGDHPRGPWVCLYDDRRAADAGYHVQEARSYRGEL